MSDRLTTILERIFNRHSVSSDVDILGLKVSQTAFHWVAVTIIIISGLLTFILISVGYVGTDDFTYVDTARNWVVDGPSIGTSHWELRHTIILPLAGSFALFGFNESTMIAVPFLYGLGLLLITYLYSHEELGGRAALFTTILLITSPIIAIESTHVMPEPIELFFVVWSFWLFWTGIRKEKRQLVLFTCGILAGFAWLTRETSVVIMIFYGVLFLVGFAIPRREYLTIFAGFAVVIGIEWLLFYFLTGDPLYRLNVDLGHADAPVNVDRMTFRGIGELSAEGNLLFYWLIDPFLVVFLNEEFGLIFLIAVPAYIWMMKSSDIPNETKVLVRLIGGLSLISFSFVALAIPVLNLDPRYFTISAYGVILLVAISLSSLYHQGKILLFSAATLVLVSTNLLCIYVDNRSPNYAAETLVTLLRDSAEVIYTDPVTARQAQLPMEWNGIDIDQVRSELPPVGALFYFNPQNMIIKRAVNVKRFPVDEYQPTDSHSEIDRFPDDRRLLGILLEYFGIDRFIPGEIKRRLNQPNATPILFRVGQDIGGVE